MKKKPKKLIDDFAEFCKKNPELRFWQALRAWSRADKIYYVKYDRTVDDEIGEDTFYWEEKIK